MNNKPKENYSKTKDNKFKIVREVETVIDPVQLITLREQTIKHIETTFKTEYDLIKGYKNCDLLVDKTIYTLIPLVSQFPVNYISSKYIELKFKINTKSKLALIVECFEETNKLNYSLDLIPVNYYFNYDCEKFDLKDIFFEEEFNMFLSNLN